jgi:hypothetical protein
MNAAERNVLEELLARVKLLEQRTLQIPSRPVIQRGAQSLVTSVNKTAHGFSVGDVVCQIYSGSAYVWQLAWGFIGLSTQLSGAFATPVFGVVSAVPTVNDFEVTTDGLVDAVTMADTGTIVSETFLDPTRDVALDLYLIDDVDNPGRVTRFRTASSIRIATWLPGQGYLVRVSRESTATFDVCQFTYATPATILQVVVDDGTNPVALADYTTSPDPKNLRILVCKYDGTHSVVLRHGKTWKGGLYAGISPAPLAGPRYLTTAGAIDYGDAWTQSTPTKHDPMIRVGYYDGDRGFFFDPRHETSLQHSWDVKAGEGTGVTAALEDADVVVWNAAEFRYRTKKIGSDSIAPGSIASAQLADFSGYAILGNPTASAAPCVQLLASNDGDVLRRVGTTLGFGKIVTVNLNDKAVTLAKLADLSAFSVIGRNTSGSGVPTEISATADGKVLCRRNNVVLFTELVELGGLYAGVGILRVRGSSPYDGVTITVDGLTRGLIEMRDENDNIFGLFGSDNGSLRIYGPRTVYGIEIVSPGPLNIDCNKLGFFNTTPITKPSVSGSRGGNAALQSLVSALATYGLITDLTT